MPMFLQIMLGILVGVVAGTLHLWLSWRAARSTVESGEARFALALMPARIVVVAILIASLALVSTVSVVSGVFGFMITQRALRSRWPDQEAT
jgi:hypothetical protein